MERTYTIPLRREWIRTVRYKRAKKTISAIREFLTKHMKADEVKVGRFLNEHVWSQGIKNPPSKVRVNAFKDKEGVVTVELFGKPLAKKVEEPKKKTVTEKIKEKVTTKTPEKPAAKKEINPNEKSGRPVPKDTSSPKDVKPEKNPAPTEKKTQSEATPAAKPAGTSRSEKKE